MNAVYETATGRLVSVGTVVASPLPDGLTSVALSVADRDGLRDGTRVWDAATRTVVDRTLSPVEANTASITDKIRAAIAGNVTALGQLDTAITNVTNNVITPTAANLTQANAQIDALANVVQALLTQSGRMMRQITAIERLLIGSDLLESDQGT